MFPSRIILASQSPRRQQLLSGAGFVFEVLPADVEEIYPDNLALKDVALYLSKLKASTVKQIVNDESAIIIAADTIVIVDDKLLGKPNNFNEAKEMLKLLSGRKHQVITGVSIETNFKSIYFDSTSDVFFRTLDDNEIDYYIEKYQPLDKAGAYGIQEWVGYIAIERVEGSFYNVMGLPIARLYAELKKLSVFPNGLQK